MTRTIHQTSSRTAAPMYGHRAYIGHSAVVGPVTPGLLTQVKAERARRAFDPARSECDRLPMGARP